MTEDPSLPSATTQNENKPSDDADETGSDRQSESEETPRKTKLQKSPLLTARRLSNSSLDDVNLVGNKEDDAVIDEPGQEVQMTSTAPQSTDSSAQNGSLQGLSGPLPSVPWGPPPVNKNPPPAAAAPPPPPTRKLTSPFAWLSRSSTSKEKSPPQSTDGSRRNTGASVSTVSSNPELASKLQDDDVRGPKSRSNSLKDQFRLLRMREEGTIISEGEETNGVSGQTDKSVEGPQTGQSENDASAPAASNASPPNVPPTVNANLAPGTVSGYSSSASDASAPVDWELWQQLVNNGSQALQSSEALNAAIKRGIPQTIRGVIWQILADSRSSEFEEVYRELVDRGTEREKERPRNSSGQVNGTGDKDSMSSSRSSVRSNNSASATQANGSTTSPSQDPDSEKQAKEQAVIDAARKKKAKDNALALQKLEKTIRRDMGARTSYSRYFVSQGNQEGLYGICKAYALYDKQVGYAQGMNFIAMPLLFNVSLTQCCCLMPGLKQLINDPDGRS